MAYYFFSSFYPTSFYKNRSTYTNPNDFDEKLEDEPELVNSDAYEAGWLVKIKLSNTNQLDGLMDAAAYKDMINA